MQIPLTKLINIKKNCGDFIHKNGIFFSSKNTPVSFPDKIHDFLFDIENKSYWFKLRNDYIIQAINKFPPKGEIIDVGGGNGVVSLALQENKYEVFLLEPDIKAIYNAKKRGVKNLICSSLKDFNIKKNSVSAIGLFDVLEHIKNDSNFLLKLKSLLKKNGKIYLTVPALSFLWSKDDVFAGHFRRYSKRNIGRILKKIGFKIEYSTYFFSFLILPILLFRTLLYKFIKRKKRLTDFRKELIIRSKLVVLIIEMLSKLELSLIQKGKKIPIGSSYLVVASKQ